MHEDNVATGYSPEAVRQALENVAAALEPLKVAVIEQGLAVMAAWKAWYDGLTDDERAALNKLMEEYDGHN